LVGRLLISRVFGLLIDGRALGLIIGSMMGVILAYEFGKFVKDNISKLIKESEYYLSLDSIDYYHQ
jgi:hypothetical protein